MLSFLETTDHLAAVGTQQEICCLLQDISEYSANLDRGPFVPRTGYPVHRYLYLMLSLLETTDHLAAVGTQQEIVRLNTGYFRAFGKFR